MRPRRAAALVSLALLAPLAGCAVPKEAGFPDVQKAVDKRAGLRVHWKTGSEEDKKAEKLVEGLLEKELTSAGAVQIALLNNPVLQATFEGLGVAQADVVQAGLLENPTFSASVAFPLQGGLRRADLGITEGFLSALLIPAKKKVAEAEFERVKLEVSQAVLDLATRTRVAYYRFVAARQMLAIGRAVLEGAEASAELAKRQADAGNIGELTSATERAAYERVLLDVARLEGQAAEAREDLIVLLGLFGPQASRLRATEKLDELPAADPSFEKLEQQAIASRFDVAAARRASESAARAIDLAKLGRYTGFLDLGAVAQRESDGHWFVGPGGALTLPIFDQGQAVIFALEARKRGADQRLLALSIEARSEVRRERDRVVLARQIAERYKSALIPVAERVVALSQQHYDAMLLGVYQLILAKRDEAEAYRGYIEALRDYWVARAELARAAGGKLPDEGPPR
jgi:cobalt-zinc-cadmium efflux system outer membrane protein